MLSRLLCSCQWPRGHIHATWKDSAVLQYVYVLYFLQLLDSGRVQLLVHDGSFLRCALNRHISPVGVSSVYLLPVLEPRVTSIEMSSHLWPLDRKYLSRQRPLLPVTAPSGTNVNVLILGQVGELGAILRLGGG